MNQSEMKVTKSGNGQLYIPLSKKLDHGLKAGDTVCVSVKGTKITVEKKNSGEKA